MYVCSYALGMLCQWCIFELWVSCLAYSWSNNHSLVASDWTQGNYESVMMMSSSSFAGVLVKVRLMIRCYVHSFSLLFYFALNFRSLLYLDTGSCVFQQRAGS